MYVAVGGDAPRGIVDLVGRDSETQTLRNLVNQLQTRGVARILRGEPGVGKSALLESASHIAESQGMQVWRVRGVRSELRIPFAGLHQILRPLLQRAEGLSQPYREVLFGTFGLDNNAPSSHTFAIAVATLELLAEVAKQAPVLIAVDDAHWLDAESTQVLGLVARRLGPDPVALLMAVRAGSGTELLNLQIPELNIEGLDEKSSAALLAARAPGLSPELRARVKAEAAGNPLALVELPMAGEPDISVFGRPDRLRTTKRLQTSLAEDFLDLPPATQVLLLVSSLDERSALDEILSAATVLMRDDCRPAVEDLTPAVKLGLIELENTRVRFRHPLTPAAIYEASSTGLRLRAHDALATVLVDDPHRSAWHRAASISRPDETIGDELEAATMNARAESTPHWRLAALERAADLSIEPAARRRRLLGAAELALEFGRLRDADRLLNEVDASSLGGLDHARMTLMGNLVQAGLVREPQALESLVAAGMAAASAGERDLGLRLLRAAAEQSWWTDLGPDVRNRISAAAEEIATAQEEPGLLSILAMCHPEASSEPLARVMVRMPPAACEAQTAFALGTALHFCGAFDRSGAYLLEAIRKLRRRSYLWLLPEALALQAWNEMNVRTLSAAAATAEEAMSVARELRQPLWEALASATLGAIHALRGEVGHAESFIADAESIALPIGARAVLADAQLARAIIAISTGQYEEAFEHLDRTFDSRDPAHHYQRSMWRIGELAEAAVHAGRVEEARAHLFAMRQVSEDQAGPRRLQMGLLYARALLSNDDEAEALFDAALEKDLTMWPVYRARLLLHYGMWLRRRRRIRQARLPLRAARDSLAALGATVWAERAGQELRASREKRHCGPAARLQLTEQELQIVRMAAGGFSNREIGQRLYISPRTVGSHLYQIFPKLGVTSRIQLSRVLPDLESSDAALSSLASL